MAADKWFKTCETVRVHCVACRSDVTWRESLRAAGMVEGAEFACPYGVTPETAPAVQANAVARLPRPKAVIDDRIEKGRAAWAWLHAEASASRLTYERLQTEFRPMIPAYGCFCLHKWDELLERLPFRPNDQVAWGVEVHNAVNADLGKPLWPGS